MPTTLTKETQFLKLLEGKNPVLLFDGVCNLCNNFVQWLIVKDKKGIFKYASLQSEFGQWLLQKNNFPKNHFDTVILLENGKIYTHSTVSLRIMKKLGGFYGLLYSFIIIPPFIRDWIYNIVANNRYKWFGKKNKCVIPKPEWQGRFIK